MSSIAVSPLVLVLGALVLVLVGISIFLFLSLRRARAPFAAIIDVDAEAKRRRSAATSELNSLALQIAKAKVELSEKESALAEFKRDRDRMRQEIGLLEENMEDISFGVYKAHFRFDTPEEYKQRLEQVVDHQKEMIRAGRAASFSVSWSIGGSRKEGERMQKQYTKLLLRAFNGECDAAVAKTTWNNVTKMEARIEKGFSAINELGGVMQVTIAPAYRNLKLEELRLEFELEENKRVAQEEQRRAKEELREQERAQRELEKAKTEAEAEESRAARDLDKARIDMAAATGAEHARLTQRILDLEAQLQGATQKRQRMAALGELTRAGYVYFLSNIGSFGENVFKIGMTRRLDPSDRVKELGDASVPFQFDTHAMVYSEDAPKLEDEFQTKFADRAINLLNPRKEFFRVSIDELQAFASERGLKIAFVKMAEAREYRETMAKRGAGAS